MESIAQVETDCAHLLHVVHLSAGHAYHRHAGRIPYQEFEDSGLNELTRALEQPAPLRNLRTYAKTCINLSIKRTPHGREVAQRREQSWWHEIYGPGTWRYDNTAGRLAWLDAQIAHHHACLPERLHDIYRAIRSGQAIDTDLARAWGLSWQALYRRYETLCLVLRRHLVLRETTCQWEQQPKGGWVGTPQVCNARTPEKRQAR